MASLRETRRRITSVKNTRQITRAMKLVAGAKLRRATDAALAAKPYQDTLQRVLSRVTANAGDVEHPLLATPNNASDVIVIVMSRVIHCITRDTMIRFPAKPSSREACDLATTFSTGFRKWGVAKHSRRG